MTIEKIEKLKEAACEILDQTEKRDLQTEEGAVMAKSLASLYLKLCEMSDMVGGSSYYGGSGYRGGSWAAAPGYGRGYPMMGGNSYAGRMYSRARGYSRDDGGEDVAMQLEQMLEEANPQERGAIQKALNTIRNMK